MVSVLTIALGIGGTTAVFTLADEVLLRPLRVRAPEELVFLKTVSPGAVSRGSTAGGGRSGAPAYPSFEHIRTHSNSFTGMAAFGSGDHLPLVVAGDVEQVVGQVASGNYFDVLGVRPVLGRTFTADDERLQPAVAVVSHRYWQRRFGGSHDVLGTVVYYEGRALTIVGVTPPSFVGLEVAFPVDITMPITIVGEGLLRDNYTSWIDVVARLKPTVTAERARAEIDPILKGFLAEVAPPVEDARPFRQVQLVPASHGMGRVRTQFARPIVLLMALVGAVLAIACANITNLLLARAAARQRELAIRAAIGAGRFRIVRQLLTESLLLFTIGSAAGVVLASGIARLLADFLAVGRMPMLLDIDLDARALAFTGGLCLLTGMLAGLAPAIRASRGDTLSAVSKTGFRSSLPVSRWLVVFQVAASIVILVGGSLLVRTLRNLKALDAGFRSEGVLTLSVRPLAPTMPASRRDLLWIDILNRVERLSGVQAASLSVLTPLSGRDRGRRIAVPGFQPRSTSDRQVGLNYVSPAYFETFGIPLRLGRPFTARDDASAPKVALINEAAARFYFGARNPLGARIIFGDSATTDATHEVVGVAVDAKHRNLREDPPRFVYLSVAQSLDHPTRLTLSVRTRGDPMAMLSAIRDQIHAADRETLVSDVMTMEQQMDQSLLRERLLSALSTAFGALGLLLAAIGLYGLASYTVVRRTNEIGIRMALGATPAAIRWSALREALGMVAFGAVIGLPLSLLAARAIRSLLFGVSPADPGTIAASITLLAMVAGLAAYLPARRASRIDPILALTRQ